MARPIPSRRAPPLASSGFTLIELLVGLSLMGMAAGLLLAGLQMAGVIANRERARSSDLEDVVAAQRILRRMIERLRPVMRTDALRPIVDLRGEDGVLRFIAPPADRDAPDALQYYRLLRTATGALTLFTASTRKPDVDLSARGLAGWTPVPLLTGTAALSIRYFGTAPGAPQPAWHARWWDRPQPPALVRIRVEFPAGDTRRWPDLIIRPGVAPDANCPIDPLTGNCKASG